ncbi:MAG: HAD hydrolase-like protein, partial [Pygmaiobacter sp.]
MKYSAVLFDLDGTLTDSAPGILGSMQYSLAQFGITATAQELRRYLGPPLREMFASYLQKEQIEAGVEIYHADYEKNGIFNATLYEGIRETLCALDAAGVKVCLATAKPQQYAQRILEHFGIDSYFEL